jgi:hypothetical protein
MEDVMRVTAILRSFWQQVKMQIATFRTRLEMQIATFRTKMPTR